MATTTPGSSQALALSLKRKSGLGQMPNASNGESCPTKLPPAPRSSMKRPGPLLKNPEDRAASSTTATAASRPASSEQRAGARA